MNPNQMTHYLTFACLLAAAAFTAPSTATAQSVGAFEAAPVLAGSVLTPPTLLKGPLHTVAEPITLEGFLGRFVIESKFGKFSLVGENMLAVRVNELQAIAALQDVQSSQAFQDSLMRAASAPVQLVQSAVTDPLRTVENIGQGLGSVLGRVGFLARSGAQAIADSSSAKMGNIAGVDSVIRIAAQVQGEVHVRFVIEFVQMLVRFNEKQGHLAKLRMSNMVPIGVKDDGTLVISAAVDYVYWDKFTSAFTQRKELRGKDSLLLVAGGASERAKLEFRKAGFTLLSGLRP